MEWYVPGLFLYNADLTLGKEYWNKPQGAQLHTEVFKLVWGGNLKDLKIQRRFLPYKESFELPTAELGRHK